MTRREWRRYRRLLTLARLTLAWERAWPRLVPVLAVLGAFLALALTDWLPGLPAGLHAAVLAVFGVALVVTTQRLGQVAWPLPSEPLARRRLERDSQLPHRPLAALDDPLLAGVDDPLARALWQRHRARAAASVRALRLRWPSPGMAARDPRGLRFVVPLGLAIAVVGGWHGADQRLARALAPGLSFGGGPSPVVEAWITPPLHTGQAPLLLTTAATPPEGAAPVPSALDVPSGSKILARVTGTGRPPLLILGERTQAFARLDSAGDGPPAFRAETTIEGGDAVVVEAGRRALASWPIRVVADQPPTAALLVAPKASGNGLTDVRYAGADDYGVSAMTAVIRPAAGDGSTAALEAEVRLDLPLSRPDGRAVEGQIVEDLSAHPLAGMAATLEIEARDAVGQVGRSTPVSFTLPERVFHHPVARVLIGERRRLAVPPPPATRHAVAATLAGLAKAPRLYDDDIVVTLALSIAKARLLLDHGEAAVEQVRELLWRTALRLDEGNLSMAEKRLREAQQALTEALNEGASVEEIDRLAEALRQAMRDYLAEMLAAAARQGLSAPQISELSDLVPSRDLEEMLDLARQLGRSGARDAARELLAELQRVLGGLRAGLAMAPSRQQLAQVRAAFDGLRELAERQQRLADDTFRKLQAGRPGREGRAGLPEQQALRQDLGAVAEALRKVFGASPPPLTEADWAMRGATEQLGAGRLGEALSAQTRAADALTRALEAAKQALAQQMGAGIGLLGGGMPLGGDPFGRMPADGRGGFATGTVKLPERSEMQRAQEILEELRRRAGEAKRTRDEREYIERLLDRF